MKRFLVHFAVGLAAIVAVVALSAALAGILGPDRLLYVVIPLLVVSIGFLAPALGVYLLELWENVRAEWRNRDKS